MRQQSEINQRIMKQESEFYLRLKAQRDEMIEQMNQTRSQIKGIDNLKLTRINQDSDYLKSMIGSVEQRIAEEVEKRLRNEFESKNFLESKLQNFKEEIRNDEKQILLGEQKFMKQIHESISSLNQIVKNTKDQLEANMAASQTIVSENIKTISKTVDIVKEGTHTKVQLIEQGQKELNFRMSETRQMFHEHANLVSSMIQKEFNGFEQRKKEMEDSIQKEIDTQNAAIIRMQRENGDWKEQFERKSLSVFSEISNALKNVKSEQLRDRKEHMEHMVLIRKEQKQQKETLEGLVSNLDQHVHQVQRQIDFSLSNQGKELQDLISNTKLQLQMECKNQIQTNYQRCSQEWKEEVKRSGVSLEELFRSEMDISSGAILKQLEESEVKMRQFVVEREKIMELRMEEVSLRMQEQLAQIQQMIDEYGDRMSKLKSWMTNEVNGLREEVRLNLKQELERITNQLESRINEEHRWTMSEVLNVELKLNGRVDEMQKWLSKQMEQLNEQLSSLEKRVKSYCDQQIEECRYELRSQIKEVENEMFKMKVWLMRQIELMNGAMQEMHLQLQSELFMERMYIMTMIDQYQEHLDSRMQLEREERLKWQDGLEQQFAQYRDEIESQLLQLRVLIKQVETDIADQFNTIHQNIQSAFNQLATQQYDQIKDNRDQIQAMYNYFESKIYIDNMLRMANESLQKEKQAGIIGKVNLLVKEMERLETKANLISTDLDQFVNAAEDNFKLIQKAIQSHTQFLNELDSKQLMEELLTQSSISALNNQTQQLITYTSSSIQAIQDQLQQILDQSESSSSQLKEDIINRIKLTETMCIVMEQSIMEKQIQSSQQTLLLIGDTNKLMLQNISTMETNMQKVMEKEITKLVDWINLFATQVQDGGAADVDELKDTQLKLIDDYNTLTNELQKDFQQVNQKIESIENQSIAILVADTQSLKEQLNTLQALNQQPQIESQVQDISSTQAAQGHQLEEIKNQLNKELDKIYNQLEMLSSEGARQQQQQQQQPQQSKSQSPSNNNINNSNTNELQKQMEEQQKQLDELVDATNQLNKDVSDEIQELQRRLDQIEQQQPQQGTPQQEPQQQKKTPDQTPKQPQQPDNKELKDLQNRLDKVEQQLAQQPKGSNNQDGQQQAQQSTVQIDQMRRKIDDANKQLDEHTETLNQVGEELGKLIERMEELEGRL